MSAGLTWLLAQVERRQSGPARSSDLNVTKPVAIEAQRIGSPMAGCRATEAQGPASARSPRPRAVRGPLAGLFRPPVCPRRSGGLPKGLAA
jgi:hypothetical protein